MNEEDFLINLRSAALTKAYSPYSEKELIKLTDDSTEPQYVARMTAMLQMSLSQILTRAGTYTNHGNGTWSNIVKESERAICDSMADKSNKKNKGGGGRKGGRGAGREQKVQRGGAAGRGGRGGFQGFRGGPRGRGNKFPRGGGMARVAFSQPPAVNNFFGAAPQSPLAHRPDPLPLQGQDPFPNQWSFPDQRPFQDQPPFQDPLPFLDQRPFPDHRPALDQRPLPDQNRFTDQRPVQDPFPFRDQRLYQDQRPFQDQLPFQDSLPFQDKRPLSDRRSALDQRPFPDQNRFPDPRPVQDPFPFRDQRSYPDPREFSDQRPSQDSLPFQNQSPLPDHRSSFDNNGPSSSSYYPNRPQSPRGRYPSRSPPRYNDERRRSWSRSPPPRRYTPSPDNRDPNVPDDDRIDGYINGKPYKIGPYHGYDNGLGPNLYHVTRRQPLRTNYQRSPSPRRYRSRSPPRRQSPPRDFFSSRSPSPPRYNYPQYPTGRRTPLLDRRRSQSPPQYNEPYRGSGHSDGHLEPGNYREPVPLAQDSYRGQRPLMKKPTNQPPSQKQPTPQKPDMLNGAKAPAPVATPPKKQEPRVEKQNAPNLEATKKTNVPSQPVVDERKTFDREGLALKVKLTLLEMKDDFEQDIPVSMLVYCLSRKNVSVPGDNVREKTEYLARLKRMVIGILDELEIDTANCSIRHIDTKGSEKWDIPKDSLVRAEIIRLVSKIKTLKFELSELIDQASKVLGDMSREKAKWHVTYVLFNCFDKGDFQYDPEDHTKNTIINDFRCVYRDSASNMFKMAFEPKRSNDRMLKVKLSHFYGLDKFSVRLLENHYIAEDIERKLNSLVFDEFEKPDGGWKVGHACVINTRRGDKNIWVRGYVGEVAPERLRVYSLDYGFWVYKLISEAKLMPRKYLEVPPCSFSCKLELTDDDIISTFDGPWREHMPGFTKSLYVALKGSKLTYGVPVHTCELFVKGPNKTKINIMDYQFE